jgi:hypothetical protein
MSLDRAAEILTWPLAELDPLRLSLRMQVSRIVFMIGMEAWLNGALGREADRERDPELESLGRGAVPQPGGGKKIAPPGRAHVCPARGRLLRARNSDPVQPGTCLTL